MTRETNKNLHATVKYAEDVAEDAVATHASNLIIHVTSEERSRWNAGINPDNYVQKEAGKGLSTNDYTNEDKAKVQAALTRHQDISGKADKSEVNAALALKADVDALPYALVVPGVWTLHSESYDVSTLDLPTWHTSMGYWWIENESLTAEGATATDPNALSLVFMSGTITATRTLPDHLADRAVNAVPVSTDTTLTLPALVNAGKARDLLVRLEISGSTVPTITFAAPSGETITYETDGDTFPAPDEAGTWLYSFTETAAHTFAVALKSVSVVTQGGV